MGALLQFFAKLPEYAKILAVILRYLPTILKLLPVATQLVKEIYHGITDETTDAKTAPASVIPINQPPSMEPAAQNPAAIRKERVAELHEAIATAKDGDWRDLARMYFRYRNRK